MNFCGFSEKIALRDLKYNPSSVLYLSAQGPDDHFDIKAKWDLANNNYSIVISWKNRREDPIRFMLKL